MNLKDLLFTAVIATSMSVQCWMGVQKMAAPIDPSLSESEKIEVLDEKLDAFHGMINDMSDITDGLKETKEYKEKIEKAMTTGGNDDGMSRRLPPKFVQKLDVAEVTSTADPYDTKVVAVGEAEDTKIYDTNPARNLEINMCSQGIAPIDKTAAEIYQGKPGENPDYPDNNGAVPEYSEFINEMVFKFHYGNDEQDLPTSAEVMLKREEASSSLEVSINSDEDFLRPFDRQKTVFLEPGTVLERWIPKEYADDADRIDNGRFFTRPNTPFAALTLRGKEEDYVKKYYEVQDGSFPVHPGVAAAYKGQPGGADQYYSEAAGKQELLNEGKLREVKVPIEAKDKGEQLDNPPLAAEEGDNGNELPSDDNIHPLEEKVDSNSAGSPIEARKEEAESNVFNETADSVNDSEKREPAEFVPLPREISREAILDGADRVGMMQSDKIQLNQWGPDQQEGFWDTEYKGRSKEEYLEMASHIPEVYERLQNGESLEDLVKDEKVGACAEQYFLPENMVTVDHYADGSYQFTDDGRHRIAAAQELGVDIPVKLNETGDPEQYEITQQEKEDRYNDLMDYMEEHNYSEIDRPTYEKDSEWQRLHDAYDHPVKEGDKPEPADWEKDADAMLKQRYEQTHGEHDDILEQKQNENKEEQDFTDPRKLGEDEENPQENLDKKRNETNEGKQDFTNVEALGKDDKAPKEGSEKKTNEGKEKRQDFSTIEALGKSDDDSEKNAPKDDDINDIPKEPIDDSHTNIR